MDDFGVEENEVSELSEEDILAKIEKEYPDANIIEQDDGYSVVSENVDYISAKYDGSSFAGLSNRKIYSSAEELLDDSHLLRDIMFIGKKTGETEQIISLDKRGIINDLYYTNSRIEVQKVFYGDVSEGDIITLKEFYAVFGSGKKAKLITTDNYPISDDEYFYSLTRTNEESLFGDEYQYYTSIDGCFKLEVGKEIAERGDELKATPGVLTEDSYKIIKRDLYNKYVVNADTALDKEEELAKAQKWAEQIGTPLTKNQLSKIDELCKKYGKK